MKLRIVTLGVVIVMLGTSAALARTLPKLPTYSGPYSEKDLQVRPATISVTKEGYVYLAGPQRSAHRDDPLSWTSWAAKSGKGSGFEWINNCKPSCYRGTRHSYPITLKAWRPRPETHRSIFTRMTVTYIGELPPGRSQRTQVWKVRARGKSYFWVLPNQ